MYLRQKIKGKITQIHDGGLFGTPADLTFTHRRDGYFDDLVAYQKQNCYVGWAADAEQLVPMQDAETLRILVDHPMYKPGFPDSTLSILVDIQKFVRSDIWHGKFKRVSVRAIVDGGVMPVNIDNISVHPYARVHVPFERIKEEYCRAHLFFPTHKESVGLTALETAMAGALVVTATDMIPADRLATIRHFKYRREIPWADVLEKIDPTKSREKASQNSWNVLVSRLVDRLQ
jgi:hypothetical protein